MFLILAFEKRKREEKKKDFTLYNHISYIRLLSYEKYANTVFFGLRKGK